MMPLPTLGVISHAIILHPNSCQSNSGKVLSDYFFNLNLSNYLGVGATLHVIGDSGFLLECTNQP
jgi:hypothetical protein